MEISILLFCLKIWQWQGSLCNMLKVKQTLLFALTHAIGCAPVVVVMAVQILYYHLYASY